MTEIHFHDERVLVLQRIWWDGGRAGLCWGKHNARVHSRKDARSRRRRPTVAMISVRFARMELEVVCFTRT